jgi:tetratricopeptide (TPR) repeat protein
MSVIFLAECRSKEQAEAFARHFRGMYWTLEDNIYSECDAEIKQYLEDNWWSILSASAIDWTPANRQEGNYRYFQILELQRHLQEHLKSAPAFRYGLIGEIEKQDLNNLLTDSDYGATYSHLVSSASSENTQMSFRVPISVYALKTGFLLSQSLYQQVGSPSNFEPFIQGYVWLPPSPTIISGGIQAPPKDVITGKNIRIFIDPNQAEIYLQKGLELNSQGQFIKALDNLEKAQKLSPFSTEIHRFKAFTLFCLKRWDEALQHCDFAIQFASPQSDSLLIAYQLKGDILYEQGKLEKALEAFNNSLELNPNDYYAFHPLYRKSLILATLGKHQEALDACECILRLNPNAVEVYELKLSVLESLISMSSDNFNAYYQKAIALRSLGRHQEALIAFETSLKLAPNNSDAHYFKGISLDMLGYHKEALECFNTTIRLNPHFANAYQGKGIALDKLGRYEEALQSLEYSLQLDPFSSNTQNSIRIVRKHLGFDSF